MLAEALTPVLAAFAPFTLALATPTIWERELLFLLVEEGREQVRRLHESVYSQVLADVQRPSQFVPHMTVGRQAGQSALAVGVREAAEMALPIIARAEVLTVYRRGESGRRVRELDLPLGAGW